MKELTDLVLRCRRAPTTEAMNELFQAVYPSIILGLTVHCGKDEPLIEDFAQHAMIKAIHHFSESTATTYAEFRAWCITIAMRAVADYYRKSSTKKLSIMNPDEIDRLREAGAQMDGTTFGLSVDSTRAKAVIESLGSPCFEYLNLFYLNGLSYAEIGQLMAMTSDAVRVAIPRCLEKARATFEKAENYA